MICAACAASTAVDPCVACGASPLLDGRYRLEAALGRGAQGATWRAVRVSDGLAVALKELRVSSGHASKAAELLEREARVLRQLQHDAVPRYVEHFVVASGRHRALCLATALIDGEDLRAVLARRRLTPAEVVDVIEELARVLAWLHALTPPIVHRDLKPANVIRRTDGRLVLVDFGAVRDAVIDPDVGGSTVAGTFGYMAPEQFAGDVSPATDLYGLGALAVALLTRREPSTLVDRLNRIDWTPHVALPSALTDLLHRLLAPHATDRPTAAALLEAIPEVRRRLDEAPPRARRAPSPAWLALGLVPLAAVAVWVGRVPAEPIETDALVIRAREEVLYTAAGWLGECVRKQPTPTGTNEIQALLPLTEHGTVMLASYRILYGGEGLDECVADVLGGLVFSPPGPGIADVWFTWTWEGLPVGSVDRSDAYNLRARAEVIDPAESELRACVDQHLPDPPDINFVQVRLVVDAEGVVSSQDVRAVYATLGLRRCLAKTLGGLRFPAPEGDTGLVWFRLVDR